MPRNLNMVLDDETDSLLKKLMKAWSLDQSSTVRVALRMMPERPAAKPESEEKDGE